MATHFSEAALKFLQRLKRHNDREWFEARREIYERELKAPLLAVVDEVNHALAEFAPEHVRSPAKTMMRIYRDTRFSPNKQPYKTNVAAWWARRGLEKTSGGGFYFQFSPEGVIIAAGAYMPERDQLLAIRQHLLAEHEKYRAILAGRRLRKLLGPLDPMRMARGPKGFPTDHPATDLILQRQWGVSATLPASVALGPSLVKEIVSRFRLGSPLVAFLNEPLQTTTPKPLF
jgi:uncharacterized protein (TIGR02453 family)